jgi:hypothetical protein
MQRRGDQMPRGGAVWQLVGLITRRSQVQILSPQPNNQGLADVQALFILAGRVLVPTMYPGAEGADLRTIELGANFASLTDPHPLMDWRD